MHDPGGAIPLKTDRLLLRELEESDFDAVHSYATDPVVVQFMPWGPNSEEDTADFLRRAQQAARAVPRTGYELAVTTREDSGLIGAIGLHKEDAEATEAMLGYCFSRSAWGRGFATEAARAMMRLGFDHLGLESIWAGCDARNHGSIGVLGKLGMTLQSRHSEPISVDGEPSESLMFRVLR